jgi:diguanylate cyclase (GGDEF)-like protein
MFDRLRVLSSRDMLTGVFNRNEMNNYVDMVSTDTNGWYKNLGVVFIDLNGLKVVNDEKGHDAGDKLLRDATNALREVFSEEMIFRAGGDEFTIIVEDTTPEDLKLQVEKTKEVSRKYDHLSLAIGYSLADEGGDIRKALHEADENMFKDKHEYYMAHPELKERVKR